MPQIIDRFKPAETSADMALYFFQALDPNPKYPAFNPAYQISGDELDFMLPADAGDALAEYIDGWDTSTSYAADSIADFNAYRNSFRHSSQRSSKITFNFISDVRITPDDLTLTTTLDYRTLNEIAVAILVAVANAGGLDDVLTRWMLTHKAAMYNCGGFTLMAVKVTETLPGNCEGDRTPNSNKLLGIEGSEQRRSFKQYLAAEPLSCLG